MQSLRDDAEHDEEGDREGIHQQGEESMTPSVFWLGWIALLISFIAHELGHVLWMQKLGIFAGLKMYWWGVECKVDREADVQINWAEGLTVYGIGFVFSLIMLPVWMLMGLNPNQYMFFQVCCSGGDFYYMARMLWMRISFNENEGMK
jgi:hypothetical protein